MVLENSLHELALRANVLGIDLSKSSLLKRIQQWNGGTGGQDTDIDTSDGMILLSSTASPAIEQHSPEGILTAGIQDVTNTLAEEYKLSDVLQMILETIYRSFRCKYVAIFIRDNKLNTMAARSGFGENIDTLLPRFKFSLAYEPDAFHLAIEKNLDIVIEDAQSDAIIKKIPKWYRDNVSANYFMLLPITVNKKAIGLIYAGLEEANSLKMSQQQLTLLRTLRNQAVLAFKQKLS